LASRPSSTSLGISDRDDEAFLGFVDVVGSSESRLGLGVERIIGISAATTVGVRDEWSVDEELEVVVMRGISDGRAL
jgi:hypothetical protein